MKQIFWALFLFTNIQLHAQKREENYFDQDPKKFISTLKDYLGQSAREDSKLAAEMVEKAVNSGQMSTEELENLREMLNILYQRRTPSHPYYKDYINSIFLFKKSGLNSDFYEKWHELFVKVTNNQKRGENKMFLTFLNFSLDLFSSNSLTSTKANSWQLESKDVELFEEDNAPVLRTRDNTLIGFTRGDTIKIYNTNGKYYPLTNQWVGGKGRLNWERAGLENDMAYATFSKYNINFENVAFSIDSALLYYKDFKNLTIYGRLEDKLVPENKAKTTSYPKFLSYKKDFELKNIVADNVLYKGDFNLIGSKIFAKATDTSQVVLEFFLKDRVTKSLIAVGDEITVSKGERVSINKAYTVLLYKKDSLIHPSLSVSYDIKKNEMKLLRGESALDRSRFFTTYHQMQFEADMVTWNFDQDSISFKMISGAGKNPAKFISEGNFDKVTYNLARGAATYDPLTLLRKCVQDFGSPNIPLSYIAQTLDKSLTEEQTLPLIFLLIENGFVFYKPETKTVQVREKIITYYLMANAKRIDFDILKLNAYGKNRSALINLKTFDMNLNDCRLIPFNDSSYVFAYPKEDSLVSIKKNRDMVFDAKILCGRMDMYGDKFNFKYDSFYIIAKKLDTMKINIPDGDKKDIYGNEVTIPLTSKIENIKGKIEINNTINKSGRIPLYYYPRLTTYAPSFVYYDMPSNNGGVYKRDKFFFEIKPFVQDSLLRFDPASLFYDGKLVTAKIFPDIPQRLLIQEDLSLGFVNVTPAEGLPTYQGRGNFTGDIRLNNKGLNGKGTLVFQTTTIQTDSVIFFPERSLAMAKDLKMKEQREKGKVEFPEVESKKSAIDWRPYSDSMIIRSTDTNSFKMYRGITSMNGSLLLSSKGLLGSGSLDWSEASVSSNLMKFKSHIMDADTAALQIKTLDGDKVTFKTPNVKAKIDFFERIGNFKSNTLEISTDFAYNQYKAFLNEFNWDIDKKILDFKAPPGSDGAIFQSTHPNQDSLQFKAKRGAYNLLTSIIKCEGVEEIKVADCKVIPFKGNVEIYPEAKLKTLTNAKILGDTINFYHTLEKANIDIYGKTDMVGFGSYNLKINGKDQEIKFNSIKVNHTEEKGPKKSILKYHRMQADGQVEEKENLSLYPNLFFFGDVTLYSHKKLLHYKGSAKFKFNNPPRITDWFDIDNDIDPAKMYFYKDTILTTADLLPLYTGIMIDKVSMSGLYTSILEGKQSPTDHPIINAKGIIMHDKVKNKYYFGDSLKINGLSLKGNMLEYNDTAGKVKAEGKLDFRFNFGGLPVAAAGNVVNDLNLKTYQFNTTLGMNFQIDKNVINFFVNSLMTEILDNKDITYDNENQRKQFIELFDKKDYEKSQAEISLSGVMQTKPKKFNYNLVFNNLNLEFNELDMAYRSKGDLNIVAFGDKLVNKQVKGWVEFGHRGATDFFNIYLATTSKEWYFITFRNGTLQIASSLEEINAAVAAVDEKKRLIKKNELEYYIYMNGNGQDAKEFNERMKNGGMFEQAFIEEGGYQDSAMIDPNLLKNTPSLDSIEKANTIIETPINEIKENNVNEIKENSPTEGEKANPTDGEKAAPSEENKPKEGEINSGEEPKEETKEEKKAREKKEKAEKEAAKKAKAEAEKLEKEAAPKEAEEAPKSEPSAPKENTEDNSEKEKEAEKLAKEEAKAKAAAEKEAKAAAEKEAAEKAKAEKEAEKKAKEEAKAKEKAEKEAKEAEEKAQKEKEKEESKKKEEEAPKEEPKN